MDSEKRKFIVLALIIVSAVIIGLIIYFMVFYSYDNKPKTSLVATETPPPTATVVSNQTAKDQATASVPTGSFAVDLVQEDALQVARTFTERFGTYSNQGGQNQFDDLNLFVTKKMKAWLSDYTKNLLADLKDYEISYVVVSQAVSARALTMDKAAGRTSALVSVKQTEQTGDEPVKVVNKNLKVELLQSGQRWKVDAVSWQ